jgi:hypothetical protein
MPDRSLDWLKQAERDLAREIITFVRHEMA